MKRLALQRRRSGGFLKADLLILTVLFAASLFMAAKYMREYGDYWFFYEDKFGPAVMFALGEGMVRPNLEEAPAIREFLTRKTEALDRTQLPENLSRNPLYRGEHLWLYLMYMVGWTWRIFGISWDALLPLYCVLFAFTNMCAYAVFRLAAGPLLATFGATLMFLSANNLFFLGYLRDYAKAPFILISIFLVGLIVKFRPRTWRLALLCLLYGVIVGFGVGVREDMFICLPPAVLAIVFLGPGRLPWHRPWSKAAALICLLAPFYLLTMPVRKDVGNESSHTMHHVLGGLMSEYDNSLGVGGVPYTLREQQDDVYIYSHVVTHARYRENNTGVVEYFALSYDAAANTYFLALLKMFPGDFVLKSWAAVYRILQYGPFLVEGVVRDSARNQATVNLFNFRWHLFGWMAGINLFLVIAATALLFMRSYRLGMAAVFMSCYFTGYSVIQFDLRHYFHLEVLFWWFPLFLLAQGILSVRYLAMPQNRKVLRRAWRWKLYLPHRGLVRVVVAAGVAAAGIWLPLGAARVVQHRAVSGLLDAYASAELEPFPMKVTSYGHRTLVEPEQPLSEGEPYGGVSLFSTRASMLVLDMDCQRRTPLEVIYTASENNRNFTYRTTVTPMRDTGSTKLRVFLPIYEGFGIDEIPFESIEIHTLDAPQIQAVYRVKDLHQLPLMVPLQLPEHRENLNLVQRMQPGLRPRYVRGAEARTANLLANGGFEDWGSDEGVPRFFEAPPGPGRAQVAREEKDVYEGAHALRMTWLEAENLGATAYTRLNTALVDIAPNTTYELFLNAKNLSPGIAQVSAWQVKPGAERPEVTMIQWGFLRTLRGVGAYKEYTGKLTTKSADAGSILLLTVELTDSPEHPGTVLWDNWRLVERPE